VAYLDKILQPGETVVAMGRLHWVLYLGALLMAVAALIIAAVAGAAMPRGGAQYAALGLAGLLMVIAFFQFVSQWLVVITTEYAVTTRRVIVKRGFFSLHTVEMSLDKIESVDVDQSVLGRMLGYGAVTIHGIGARWDPLPNLADPLSFRQAITLR
jgi:uncharacterized membrane protein YdbT with pleckstrin-like domain